MTTVTTVTTRLTPAIIRRPGPRAPDRDATGTSACGQLRHQRTLAAAIRAPMSHGCVSRRMSVRPLRALLPHLPLRPRLPRLRPLGQLRRCHNDAHRTTSLPQRRSYRHPSCSGPRSRQHHDGAQRQDRRLTPRERPHVPSLLLWPERTNSIRNASRCGRTARQRPAGTMADMVQERLSPAITVERSVRRETAEADGAQLAGRPWISATLGRAGSSPVS